MFELADDAINASPFMLGFTVPSKAYSVPPTPVIVTRRAAHTIRARRLIDDSPRRALDRERDVDLD
jgi:hypothetical protein